MKWGWAEEDQERCWELVIQGLESRKLTDDNMFLPRNTRILGYLLYTELRILIL